MHVDRGSISYIMAAGNTTMTCLLVGIDPKYLRLQPYVPPADFIPPVRAVNLGDGIHVGRHVHVYTFPTVASYAGGDIVSEGGRGADRDGEDHCTDRPAPTARPWWEIGSG